MGKLLQSYLVPHPPIVVPTVGRGEEAPAKKTIDAMERVASEVAQLAPTLVIVLTPHGRGSGETIEVAVQERLYGDMSSFGAPETRLELESDTEFAREFLQRGGERGLPLRAENGLPALDHAAFVPLWFLSRATKDFRVVYIATGFHETEIEEAVGAVLRETIAARKERAVLIVSGDQSHCLSSEGPYGFSPHGMRFEERMNSIIEEGDLSRLDEIDDHWLAQAQQCGMEPLRIAKGAMAAEEVVTEIYSHEWPFGVGYLVARLMKEDRA
jgi:AmmeMemoRadiSam system protein B